MALTAADVRAHRFTPVRWREGYDMQDVDELLRRAAEALATPPDGRGSRPLLTAEQVRSARFPPTKLRHGYDQDEVDDYLDVVAAALDGTSVRSGISSTQPASGWSPAAARRLSVLLHVVGVVGLALLLGEIFGPLEQPAGWVGVALMLLDVGGSIVVMRRLAQPPEAPGAGPGG